LKLERKRESWLVQVRLDRYKWVFLLHVRIYILYKQDGYREFIKTDNRQIDRSFFFIDVDTKILGNEIENVHKELLNHHSKIIAIFLGSE
jgi:hypothetical protein